MKAHHPLRWVLWALVSIFYFYEYFLRVSPSVMIPELMSSFNVNAAAVGNLSAFYYYIYAPMQLIVGILTDRYGARRLLALASFGAGLGTLLFALSNQYWMLCVGRLLMGSASAFGFVGLLYICSHWFPIKRRGLLIGLGNALGMFGAVFGQGPFRLAINSMGWRPTMINLSIFGFVLSGIIFFLVSREPPLYKGTRTSEEHILSKLKIISKNGYSWLNAISSSFLFMFIPAFAALWGIPFLHVTYGITVANAGFAISMIFVGFAVGGPILGRYSDAIGQKKPVLITCMFAAAILLSLIVFIPAIPLPILFVLLFLIGFVCSSQLLSYSYSIDINPSHAKGTAAAFTNFVVYCLTSLSQPIIGIILDTKWTGQIEAGARIYTPQAYQEALSTLIISFLIGAILAIFLKKTKIKKA